MTGKERLEWIANVASAIRESSKTSANAARRSAEIFGLADAIVLMAVMPDLFIELNKETFFKHLEEATRLATEYHG